ncbi:hypothetical protein [Stenotrophomonas maltophilia]|uniref:hypothetical protein n=1 Tax=Stenotrophomonas maltophilia TaxID=40324 RepID=UPI0039F72541
MRKFLPDAAVEEWHHGPSDQSIGGVMYIFLAVVGLLAALVGALMLTKATMGVGVIAFGIFLAALARIIQAERHQAQLLNK